MRQESHAAPSTLTGWGVPAGRPSPFAQALIAGSVTLAYRRVCQQWGPPAGDVRQGRLRVRIPSGAWHAMCAPSDTKSPQMAMRYQGLLLELHPETAPEREWLVSLSGWYAAPTGRRPFATGATVAWPLASSWHVWQPIAKSPHFSASLVALHYFCFNGHSAAGSWLPDLVAGERITDLDNFWSTLQVLARDGSPPAIAVSSAARL